MEDKAARAPSQQEEEDGSQAEWTVVAKRKAKKAARTSACADPLEAGELRCFAPAAASARGPETTDELMRSWSSRTTASLLSTLAGVAANDDGLPERSLTHEVAEQHPGDPDTALESAVATLLAERLATDVELTARTGSHRATVRAHRAVVAARCAQLRAQIVAAADTQSFDLSEWCSGSAELQALIESCYRNYPPAHGQDDASSMRSGAAAERQESDDFGGLQVIFWVSQRSSFRRAWLKWLGGNKH